MADAKVSALSELSVADFSDDVYIVDNTGPTSYKLGTDRLGGLLTPQVCEGRLTLTSNTAVTTSDVTDSGTLYFTPYKGSRVGVWDGTRMLLKQFTQIELTLTLTNAKNYDVFIDDDAATLTLSAAWSSDTARTDALATQVLSGNVVLNSDHTKRWLGTIRASGTNVTTDSKIKRFVSNAFNRVPRLFYLGDTTSHTYTTGSFREWNNGTGSARMKYVMCEAGTVLGSITAGFSSNGGAAETNYMSIGNDSTSAQDTISACSFLSNNVALAGSGGSFTATGHAAVSAGYHELIPIELGAAASATYTFYTMSGHMLG